MNIHSNAWKNINLKALSLKLGIEAPVNHETNKTYKIKEKAIRDRFDLHTPSRKWQQEHMVSNWEKK